MREVGARVMFVTLSQNFAGWSPGASRHRAGLEETDLREWERLVAEGHRLSSREAGCGEALESYRAALEIDPEFAALHFEVAECERRLERSFGLEPTASRRRCDSLVPHRL